ncbi:hypothetical protein V3C99_007988 [Haemonchus contortus]
MTVIDFNPVFINCYYAIFVTVAVSTNLLLLYLINHRTPDIVRSMKAMLMIISTAQIVLALVAWFSQGSSGRTGQLHYSVYSSRPISYAQSCCIPHRLRFHFCSNTLCGANDSSYNVSSL